MTTLAQELAKEAKMCQENGLVPVISPNVAQSSEIEDSIENSGKFWDLVFGMLRENDVCLEGIIFSPAFVRGASSNSTEMAEVTKKLLLATVPKEVQTVNVRCDGLDESEAKMALQRMKFAVKYRNEKLPWNLSFAFGKVVTDNLVGSWMGLEEK